MSDERHCPECGKPVASASKGMLCPNCLLRLGLEDSASAVGESGSHTEQVSGPLPGLPERIGAYRIVEELGEGGMGEVYKAEQEKPVRRKVALKLIKLGMDSKQVLARFESERQALALMSHPAVAKVFDAGTSPEGRPFFAMEYVKGEPITAYCDRHRLNSRERLELFVQVCEGVQHAHRKGIIHRDIKPSNVLVAIQDGKAVPKIIDFGVAKATEQRLTEKTVFTQMGALIGTPEYMSPEQAEMTVLDIDTRTDVYSLGVMLYELLVGALPFDPKELRQAGFEGIVQKIREVEPPRPSMRLSTLGKQSTESAQRRRVDVSTLQRQLRGDLDWITMRALEKDRTRRYGSPQELAADIERHLRDQPVLAGPPSMVYRTKKFVRRHKVGVGVAAAGLVVLIAFAGVMAHQANRIARERDRANQEAETAKQVSDFLVQLFEVSDPGEARGNEVTAREIMDKGAERVRTELSDQPLVQARLLYAMGSVYLNLGLFEEARGPLEDSWRIRRSLLGESHAEAIESANRLSSLLWAIGDSEESQKLERSTLEILKRTRRPDDEQLLRVKKNLGLSYVHAGKYTEAEPLLLDAAVGLRRLRGELDRDTLAAQNDLAMLYLAVGRFDEAIALNTEILAKRREVLGDDHPDTLEVMQNLGVAYQYAGRLEEAEPLFAESLEISRRVRPDHPDTLICQNNLAILYRDLGRLADAERLLVDVVDSHRERMGDAHPGTLMTLGNLGEIYTLQGRYDEAEELLVKAVEGLRRANSGNGVVIGYTIRKLGACLTGQRRFDEAQSMLLEAHEMLVEAVGPDHPQTVKVVHNLVELYEAWNRPAEVERWRSELAVGSVDGSP